MTPLQAEAEDPSLRPLPRRLHRLLRPLSQKETNRIHRNQYG